MVATEQKRLIKVGDRVRVWPGIDWIGAGQFRGEVGTVRQAGFHAHKDDRRAYQVRMESGPRAMERWWFRRSELELAE